MTMYLPLMENVLTPLTGSVLSLLGVTAKASAIDAATQKRTFGLCMTTLVFSKKGLDDIMKIVKYFEESGLLIQGFSETIKNEKKSKEADLPICY